MEFNPNTDTDDTFDYIARNEEAFLSFKEKYRGSTFQASNEEETFIIHPSTRTGISNWQTTRFENGKPQGHETRETWDQAVDIIEDDIDWTDENNYKVMSLSEAFQMGVYNMDVRKMFKESKVLIEKEEIKGGLADGKTVDDIAKHHDVDKADIEKEFKKGIKVEHEHTGDEDKAKEIALDHLWEDPKYYTKLSTIEDN